MSRMKKRSSLNIWSISPIKLLYRQVNCEYLTSLGNPLRILLKVYDLGSNSSRITWEHLQEDNTICSTLRRCCECFLQLRRHNTFQIKMQSADLYNPVRGQVKHWLQEIDYKKNKKKTDKLPIAFWMCI